MADIPSGPRALAAMIHLSQESSKTRRPACQPVRPFLSSRLDILLGDHRIYNLLLLHHSALSCSSLSSITACSRALRRGHEEG